MSLKDVIENNRFSRFSISFWKIFIGNQCFFAFPINLYTIDVFENALENSMFR